MMALGDKIKKSGMGRLCGMPQHHCCGMSDEMGFHLIIVLSGMHFYLPLLLYVYLQNFQRRTSTIFSFFF
jgi:hypothetical protein